MTNNRIKKKKVKQPEQTQVIVGNVQEIMVKMVNSINVKMDVMIDELRKLNGR